MKEEIQNWLDGPQDYAEGRAIFEKYSRKTPLINLFRRKYKPEVLLYNLQKLGNFPEKKVTGGTVVTVGTVGTQKLQVVVPGKVDYEKLPVHLQKLYDQNKELYKHQRVYHEKMKQAATDEERAKFRKMVAEYDDVISGNWKEIDAWDGRGESMDMKEFDADKEIANARKFLSVNVKYLDLREGVKQQLLLFEIKEKAEQLQSLGVMVPKATTAALKKFGIHI